MWVNGYGLRSIGVAFILVLIWAVCATICAVKYKHMLKSAKVNSVKVNCVTVRMVEEKDGTELWVD